MLFADISPKILITLSRYVLPTCAIFGMVGCCINILVFRQRSLRSNACAIYMLAINVVSLIAIPYSLGRVTAIAFLPMAMRPTSVIFCRITYYVQHCVLNAARSYTVLACIDRFMICSADVNRRAFSSVTVARTSVITATIAWIVIPIHIFVFYEINPSRQCVATGLYGVIFSIYSVCVTGGHLILMIVFSSMAIHSVRKTHLRVQPMNAQRIHANQIRKRDFQLIKMLFGEVLAYLLTSAMFPLLVTYSAATANVSKSSERLAVEGFFGSLVPDFLVMINPCTTFYVYLCASKTFRTSCKNLILSKCRRNHPMQGTDMLDRRDKSPGDAFALSRPDAANPHRSDGLS